MEIFIGKNEDFYSRNEDFYSQNEGVYCDHKICIFIATQTQLSLFLNGIVVSFHVMYMYVL